MRRIATIATLATAYVVAATLGLRLDAAAGFASLVWAPSGLSLASLVLLGPRVWPAVALGALLANLGAGAPIGVALGIAVGNTLEAVLGSLVVRRMRGSAPCLHRVREAVGLIVAGAILSTAVSASIGVASLWLGDIVGRAELARTWLAWWLGDAIGVLIVAPLLLVWASSPPPPRDLPRMAEATALGLITALAGLAIHRLLPPGSGAGYAFIVFPLLMWASVRFGPRGTVTTTFLVAAIAVWGTAVARGPFVRENLFEGLLALQAFMAVTSATFLVLAASIAEGRIAASVLRESEARKAGILEASLDCIISIDHRGALVDFNAAAERTFGWRREDVLGQEMAGFLIPPRFRDAHRAGMAHYLATREGPLLGQRIEVTAMRADGTEFPAELAITPIATDGPPMFTGHLRDVSDRKRAAEAAERQFRTMIEWMPQLAWWARPDGYIDYYNPRWYEYTGTAPADMEGWGWQSVHDPALLPSVMERWQHSIATGELFEMEFPLRGRDGVFRWFLTRVTPMRGDDGEIVRWIGINTDIDDQKRALELVADTLESMGDAFFLLDRDYRIVRVNRNHERISRTTREQTLGRIFWEVFPPAAEPTSRYWTEYHRVVEERCDAHFVEYYAPLDVWTEVDAFPSRDGGVAVFFRDVSERKRAEQQRAALLVRETEARAAAESASRAKDEFLAMLGHELRNPLAPIQTALELMRLRGAPGTERERGVIERQVTHLVRLVDDVLDVSRITRGKVELAREVVDLADVAVRAVETASPLLEQRRQRFRSEVPRGLEVVGDADRLQQVFSNLLSNAAKYTPEDGSIAMTAVREGDTIVVRVTDSGVGLGPELVPVVFDMFVQGRQELDRSQGGLGLGLTIVRRLVELHGGQVEAASDGLGCGSTFTVRLPAAPADVRREPPAGQADAVTASGPKGIDVLLVDDNDDAAEMLADLLRGLGYTVQTANDGPAALALMETFSPDVAVLDIGLPVMDGYELARRVRLHVASASASASIGLIALTGYGQPSDRDRALEAGFDAHLVKPVDIAQLTALLDELGRAAGSPPS